MKNASFAITDDLIASRGQRFLNFCFDLVFLYIIILSIGTSIILIAEVANEFTVSAWVENLSDGEIAFYSALIVLLYYSLTEIYFSRTIAQLITKTVVVNKDGTKPDIKMLVIRSLCRFIPFEPFSFLGTNPRGWHDTLSETYVVKKKKLAKNVRFFNDQEEFTQSI
ncbi:RDD family protein [Flavobacterium sp. XN-5]|uniref:RDD family protein n=1 Tax=Flavobacterium sp. XN-5 TaxID=2599390 RepID=UPI0011CADD59|nr:RDD family protein [Flavobacterium sp. XN-5]NGY36361.1 RDD family protein [Flavobacterium sp. XN-5]